MLRSSRILSNYLNGIHLNIEIRLLFVCFLMHWIQCIVPIYSWVYDHPLKLVQSIKATLLIENDCPLPAVTNCRYGLREEQMKFCSQSDILYHLSFHGSMTSCEYWHFCAQESLFLLVIHFPGSYRLHPDRLQWPQDLTGGLYQWGRKTGGTVEGALGK